MFCLKLSFTAISTYLNMIEIRKIRVKSCSLDAMNLLVDVATVEAKI